VERLPIQDTTLLSLLSAKSEVELRLPLGTSVKASSLAKEMTCLTISLEREARLVVSALQTHSIREPMSVKLVVELRPTSQVYREHYETL
jgi:hypothetical protein